MFVLAAVPVPVPVTRTAAKTVRSRTVVHLAEPGSSERTLCGLAGPLVGAGTHPAGCRRCVDAVDSAARAYRIVH